MKPIVWMTAATLLATTAAAAPPERKEGNWEVKVDMEMVGMPMKMPPVTVNQCVSGKDVVPDMSQGDQQCIVKDQKITGDTVTWKMQCTSKQGKMTGEGRMQYSGERYQGQMQMNVVMDGGPPMDMKYALQGRWTGPCKPDSKKARRADDY